MAISINRKLLNFRWLGPDLTLNLSNAPWLSNVLRIEGLTTPGSNGANAVSTYTGAFNGATPGGTLSKLVQNTDYRLNSGAYNGWSLPTAVEVFNLLNPGTIPQLAAPTGLQATATSASALNVVASSVPNATSYRLYTATTQAGTYTQLGGVLATPSYSHTGLSAAQTQWYKWQAVGDGTTYSDSAQSAAFSGTTSTASPNAPALAALSSTPVQAGLKQAFTGTKLTGATAFTINGAPVRSFTVDSDTQITALLYNRQTTGKVSVTTPNGTAVSSTDLAIKTDTSTLRTLPVYLGDSIVHGPSDTTNISYYLQQLLGATAIAPLNYGTNGAVSADMAGGQADGIIGQADLTTFDQLTAYLGIGVNNLMLDKNGAPALKVDFQTTVQKLRQYGAANGKVVKIIIDTLLPNGKQYGNTSLTDYEAVRQVVNADRVQNYLTDYDADYVVNYMAYAPMCDQYDRLYFSPDQQHPEPFGQSARADYTKAYMQAAIAGSALVAPPAIPVQATNSATVDLSQGAPNKTAWFKATTGVTHTGSLVSKWADTGLKGDSFTNVAGSGPSAHYIENALNGKPAIELAGGLLVSAQNIPISGTQPFLIQAVVQLYGQNGAQGTIIGLGTSFKGGQSNVDLSAYQGKLIAFYGAGDNQGVAPALPTNTPVYIAIWCDGTNTYSQVNGTISAPTALGRDGSLPSEPIVLGPIGYLTDIARTLLGEFIIHGFQAGGYTDSYRTTNEAYLKAQFGLTY